MGKTAGLAKPRIPARAARIIRPRIRFPLSILAVRIELKIMARVRADEKLERFSISQNRVAEAIEAR